MAESSSDLAGLLKSGAVKNGARVLRIGTVSPAADRRLRPVLGALAAREFVVEGDAFNVPFPRDMDVAIVALPLAATADLFEELIYESVAPSLSAGGVAVLQFCRNASNAALGETNLTPTARSTLQNFLTANFGGLTLEILTPIAERFADDGVFECVGWTPRTKADVRAESLVWLVLRKRGQETARRAIARSRRPDRYGIDDLTAFIHALREDDLTFVLPDEFVSRTRAGAGAGLIKLDLHRNIRRPPELARALRDAGAPALFLMMHRHPFNEAFFAADETWDILKSICDDGHAVGLHLDPFHLIRTFGDLYLGIEAALADFAKHGFTVRAATLHGDTSAHVGAVGMKAWDFFVEDAARRSWSGDAPDGEAFLADHVGRYSHVELATRFGIAHMAEAHYRHNGELVVPHAVPYLTDNARALQLHNVPPDHGPRMIGMDRNFTIPVEFARDVVPAVRGQAFLALFHPQWFW